MGMRAPQLGSTSVLASSVCSRMAVLVKAGGVVARDTRSRMLDAAVDALRRNGVSGTAFSEILAASGAARGAIYHHFPGGKTQLVAGAAAQNGRKVQAHFETLPAATPQQLVEDFLAMVRPVVAESSAGSGCAVAALAVSDTDTADRLLGKVSAAAFDSWVGTLTDRLTA